MADEDEENPYEQFTQQSYPDPQQGGNWTVEPHPSERYDDIQFHPDRGEENPYAKFASQGAEEENPYAKFATAKEEPPSAVGTAVRGVLRGAIPMTAGVLGGAAGAAVGGAAGAGAGSLALPVVGTVTGAGVGAFGGALAGGYAGSELARSAQEKITDTLGIDSPESRATDAAAHPYISQGAELATGLGSLGTAGKLGARVAVGGLMGGVDLLNQGFHKGFSNIDPTEAAIAAGFGAAAPTPRAWTNKITGPVEAGAAKFFRRTPQGEAAPGQTNAPAGEITQQGLNVETPDVGVGQAPTANRLDTQFPKTSGITEVDNIHMTPDVAVAMAEHPPAAGSDVNETPPRPRETPLNQLPFAEEAEPLEGGYDEITPRVERTLSPEEIAKRQAELIATPARPMVGKSGIPFAPQAKNLRVGEEPPPATDVTSGPGRFSDGDSVATAPDATAPPSAGTESSPTSTKRNVRLVKDEAMLPDGVQGYTLYDNQGQPLARLTTTIEGDTARVNNVYTKNNPAIAADKSRVAQEQANTLGPGVIREAMRQFLEQNPSVKKLTGDRVSGARFGGGYQGRGEGPPVTVTPRTQSENFGGRGVDGQNENIPDFLRRQKRYPAGQNAESGMTRMGTPLRALKSQNWVVGQKVNVGFLKNLEIISKDEDGSFTLKSSKGRYYNSAPHQGIKEVDAPSEVALMRSREERLASAERGPIQPKIGKGEPPLAMSRKTPSKGPEDILKQIDDAAKSFAEETGQEYKEQPPGAKAFANAETPAGGAPRDLRAKIENAIKETGFAKMWNHFLNVRGMYSPTAEAASGVIRKTGTDLAKGANQAIQALKPYQNLINALPAEARAKVAEDIQSGKSEWAPELKPVVDAISKLRKQAEQKLEAAKIPAKFELNSELGPRFSRAEAKGKKAQKSILSMEDFNEQHPERPNPDPIAATLDRAHEIDKFIAKNEVLKFADERGYLAREPQPGWTKLDVPTQNLYAPEDFARQYNNAVSQGIHGISEKAGDLYDGWRRSTNFVTQVSLAGPLFHTTTMIRGALDSKMAQAITHFAAGDFATGLKRFAEIPLSPYTYAFNKGTKGLQDVWNNKPASAEDVALSKILDEAGHRPVGYQHALDLETSGLGSLFDAFKEGRLGREMGEAGQRIKGAGNILQQGKQTGAEAFRILGRAMSTIQQPLFQHYIPALKTGVIREKLVDWLAANETASAEEKVRAARRIVDNVDAVFGEMIQDNIMWNKTAKQTAMGMMRSYSWFLGTAESLVGGSKTLLTHPERLRMSDINHDPNAAFVLGMAAMGIITNSIYQYLKTGKPPQEPMDLVAGRTGGKLPGRRPERAIFPGYEKDVFGWLHDPVAEAKGKIATLPMDIWETITNRGWHTDKNGRSKYGPIANENAPFLTRLGQYAHHIGESVIPIQAQTFTRKPKSGSAIKPAEQYANIRPAPDYLSGPNPKQQQAVAREWKRTHPGER